MESPQQPPGIHARAKARPAPTNGYSALWRSLPRGPKWARDLLAATIVALIVLIAVLPPRVRDLEKALSGFWFGDPAFLNQAGLSEMYLYLAPRERVRGQWCRQGYLVMVDIAGHMVSNQAIEIAYGCLFGRWKSALWSHCAATAEAYQISRAEMTYDDFEVMPTELRLRLNPAKGTLTLYDDRANRKIYALLVKDNEASIVANAEYHADSS